MKNFKLSVFLFLSVIAMVAVLQSCSKEESPGGGPEPSLTELRLTSGVVLQSKASYPQADVQITEGEEVMVYVDRAAAETEQLYSQKLSADGAGNLTGATTMYFPENGDNVNIYALHTNSTAVTAGSFPATFTHAVSADQTTLDAYVFSDLLYAKAADIAKTTNAVPLQFYHQLSKLRVAIVAKDGISEEDISEITVNGLKLSADVTLTKDAAPNFLRVAASGTPQPIKIGTDLSADFTEENVRFNDAIIVPQDVAAGTEFLKISFTDGTEVTSELYSEIVFTGGKQYTMEITLNKGILSLTTSVSDWIDGGMVPIDVDITSSFDAAFAEELQARGYIPDADRISAKDVAAITELVVSGSYDAVGELTSLKGIEYFTSLEYLDCSYNKLTSLNISNNTALTDLNCSFNSLTSLDVGNNMALATLWCNDNSLISLDISNNTALIDLYCTYNELTSLDVSSNTALTYLRCSDNLLTSLDISNNVVLTELRCNDNFLTSLDVSSNTALTYLRCSDNLLTSLDVGNNVALIDLSCDYNKLTSLNVSNNTALIYLDCSSNSLTLLDISNNTSLIDLSCADNKLASLDVSNNTALTRLSCSGNSLTLLDVSKNFALTYLNCSINPLTSLDVSKNVALTDLTCSNNKLTSLNVSSNTAMTWLVCPNNSLTSLDVSNNTALTSLSCSNNKLTSLDISNNTALARLKCSDNPGDGANFNVAAWFDNNNIPDNFTTGSWNYNDKSISINYYIPE